MAENTDFQDQIALLRNALAESDNRLEYWRNWYYQQMREKERAIAESLADELRLELQAISETTEYIDDDNKRRIRRRLQRIERILSQFSCTTE